MTTASARKSPRKNRRRSITNLWPGVPSLLLRPPERSQPPSLDTRPASEGSDDDGDCGETQEEQRSCAARSAFGSSALGR